MLGTRYEDYTVLNDGLPFILACGIERGSSNYSRETNWHENLEIQVCTDGEGYILLDGERVSFNQGEIAVMNSNVIHYTSSERKIIYTCLIISSDFCRAADIDHTSLLFEQHFTSKRILSLFSELTETYFDTQNVCRTALLYRNILDILIELKKNHTVSNSSLIIKKEKFETIKGAIKYIRDNYTTSLTLDIIAKSVFTDKYTLSRNFKSATGQTVVGYINSFRCRKAAELISSGMRVSEAAEVCGYNNMSYFSKTFKKHMGVLPHSTKSN